MRAAQPIPRRRSRSFWALCAIAMLVGPARAAAQALDPPAVEADGQPETPTDPEPPDGAAPEPPPTASAATPEAAASARSGGASAVATVVLDRDGSSATTTAPPPEPPATLLHGFRLGYVFVANHDEPIEPGRPETSLRAREGLENPHQFLLGYEVLSRMTGSGWLNVLLIGNFSVTGLEQSKLFPSANLILGFELDRSFQTGVGINLMPVDDKAAHMIIAAGWTPATGDVHLPLHVFLIPDIDGNHRIGTTFGVSWGV